MQLDSHHGIDLDTIEDHLQAEGLKKFDQAVDILTRLAGWRMSPGDRLSKLLLIK